ncbi:Mon2/Sec7/BIG1-like, HUS domain [Dillenia turbinata]|uniref:Mon2/Sec7/BIG1-like, HUS domain n=1 Tax=Dillenia turbinata TaxID=194707 RepID=A0AAN8YXS3_9MAGN
MPSSQTLGGTSRSGRVLGPSLDKIIKNVAWRKHAQLVASCKSAFDKLDSLSDSVADSSSDPHSPPSPLLGIPLSDAEFVLNPILLALESVYPKVVDPALECLFKLFSLGLIRAEIDRSSDTTNDNPSPSIAFRLLDSVCKCSNLGDDAIELSVLRVLLSAVRSSCLLIRGDFLAHIVRTCYNVYLSSASGTNQICAKSVLAQIVIIVFARVEEDSMDVNVRTVSVSELLELTDRNLSDGNSANFVQNFIYEVMEACEGTPYPKQLRPRLENENGDVLDGKGQGDSGDKELNDGFKSTSGNDQILLRGKVLSLELLKVVMDKGGSFWRTDDRFLGGVKQYLCLSLLKNSAVSVMTNFQLMCSIFTNLLLKYRSGLKSEIGIFYPMLVLRVLENVLQPSFLQKMTVLNLLDKISQDSQLMVDIFVNYDCDVDSPNIFERTVNGLLKTALGLPPGSTTTLSPAQDITFRFESVKCLVSIIKSMGTWMDQQLRIGDSYPAKGFENDSLADNQPALNGGVIPDHELNSETNSELSNAATLEQR